MSSFSQLSEASAVSGAMQVPVYDSANGQPRKVSVTQLMDFVQSGLDSDTSGPFRLSSYTVAELAAGYPASSWMNAVVYCTNGNGGAPCLAVSNGTSWLRVPFGAAVAA